MKSSIFSMLLPFEKYRIQTHLSEEEIIHRLDNITQHSGKRPSSFLFGLGTLFGQSSGARYEGKIEPNNFKISRVISYRNSFLPVIQGTVSSFLNQREIAISMSLNLFVKIFMGIWLTLTSLASIFTLYRFFTGTDQDPSSPGIFIPLQMVVFGYLLMLLAFKFESRKSKKELNDLLEAQETSSL